MRAPQRLLEGDEVKRKHDCQACGKPKLEGEVCESCGWPQIEIKETADAKLLIFLPLCPSTNARQIPKRYGKGLTNTPDVTDYIASVSGQLRPLIEQAREAWGWRPITRWQSIELWTILRTTSADCHNYGKVLFDALEAGGLCWDDKYLIPLYRGLSFDYKAPGIIVKA
jgi:ribosomal protein L32